MTSPGASDRAHGAGPVTPHLRLVDALGLLTTMSLWTLCYPLISVAVRYAPALHLAAIRAAVAGATLIVAASWLGRPRPQGRDWLGVFGIAATATLLGFAGMFLAGGRIDPGLATVLANSQPLIAVLLAFFVLGERVRGRGALALSLGFGGIVIVATPTLSLTPGTTTLFGAAMVLMSAFGVACGNVLMKRMRPGVDVLGVTGWQLLIGSIGLALVARLVEPRATVHWSAALVLSLMTLAIPGTAVAFVLWYRIVRRVPLHRANTFTFATPVIGLLIAAGFYGETLSPTEIVGATIVIVAGYLASRPHGGSHAPNPRRRQDPQENGIHRA